MRAVKDARSAPVACVRACVRAPCTCACLCARACVRTCVRPETLVTCVLRSPLLQRQRRRLRTRRAPALFIIVSPGLSTDKRRSRSCGDWRATRGLESDRYDNVRIHHRASRLGEPEDSCDTQVCSLSRSVDEELKVIAGCWKTLEAAAKRNFGESVVSTRALRFVNQNVT